jgi:hypothetical protein
VKIGDRVKFADADELRSDGRTHIPAYVTLYGSSPSLDGIGDVIQAFYCGERKELRPIDGTTWSVHRANGERLFSVIVRLKKDRYRFERIEL